MTKKITPELLRECAEKYHKSSTPNTAVIERDLGVEHRHIELLSNMLEGIADSIEQYYIELPTDKDGNLLRIGQFVYAKDGTAYFVHGFSSGRRNVFLSEVERDYGAGGKASAKPYNSKEFTLNKPDSWERIIEDALIDGMNLITKYGDELMLKMGCSKEELIARCRKLADEADE